MSCEEIKKKSVTEIFKRMVFSDKEINCKVQSCNDCLKIDKEIDGMEDYSELNNVLKSTPTVKLLENAVTDAVKAHNKWKNLSSLERGNSLHKIWKCLVLISKLSKFKNELSTLANFFDFYADVAVHTEEYKSWSSCGVVLVVLPNYCPFFALGAAVTPALATGCSVIVLVPEKIKNVSFFLAQVISEAGLPEGVFNTVTEFNEIDLPVSKEINKVFFCGSYLSAVKLYTTYVTKSFNFFCPGNTAAFVLESGDLDAAADKIITETCVKNSLFAVSNIVIQESVHKKFLEKLKYRLQQFKMTNKDSSEFNCKISLEVNEITTEALNAGAFDEKNASYENEITQTVIENHQNHDIEGDITVFKIQVCRTAKEGIALLNNCRHSLGTSIWSEISSQALEISTMLSCPSIWINNHGMFDAGEPLELQGFSGNCVLGGFDGVFEYLSFGPDHSTVGSKTIEDESLSIKKITALQIAVSAQSAFNIWQHNKNRRQYLRDITDSLKDSEELAKLSGLVSTFAHIGNLTTFSQRTSQGYLVLKRKIPVGVFLLFINSTTINVSSFASLIIPVIAFGNAIIVVFKEINAAVTPLVKKLTEILPKNLFNVMVGIKNGIYLASDPHIQAIWVYDESAVSVEFLQLLKYHSARSLKRIWVIPKNLPASPHFFQKECLKNHVVWLTHIDQFP